MVDLGRIYVAEADHIAYAQAVLAKHVVDLGRSPRNQLHEKTRCKVNRYPASKSRCLHARNEGKLPSCFEFSFLAALEKRCTHGSISIFRSSSWPRLENLTASEGICRLASRVATMGHTMHMLRGHRQFLSELSGVL